MREDRQTKIPYDNDPILRQSPYEKKSRGNSGSKGVSVTSKGVALALLVLFVLNIITLIVAISKSGATKNVVNNYENNIYSEGIDVSAVSAVAMPSVVRVHTGLPSGVNLENYDSINSGAGMSEQQYQSMSEKGAGIIIDDDKNDGTAYILTCEHVIRPSPTQVFVMLFDNTRPILAKRVSSTAKFDVAVLKIEKSEIYKASAAEPCEVAASSLVSAGDGVVAIGNPLGTGFSVTSGVISKTQDSVTVRESGRTYRTMRISAPINAGNSGGGIFNAKGQLLGMVIAKLDTSNVDCVAYATPSDLDINIAENIIRNGEPRVADIGLELENDTKTSFEQMGGKTIAVTKAIVKNVTPGSQAYSKGIKVGDIIVSFTFDGKLVNMINAATLEDYLFAFDVGTEVRFVIERDGKIVDESDPDRFLITIQSTRHADD